MPATEIHQVLDSYAHCVSYEDRGSGNISTSDDPLPLQFSFSTKYVAGIFEFNCTTKRQKVDGSLEFESFVEWKNDGVSNSVRAKNRSSTYVMDGESGRSCMFRCLEMAPIVEFVPKWLLKVDREGSPPFTAVYQMNRAEVNDKGQTCLIGKHKEGNLSFFLDGLLLARIEKTISLTRADRARAVSIYEEFMTGPLKSTISAGDMQLNLAVLKNQVDKDPSVTTMVCQFDFVRFEQ